MVAACLHGLLFLAPALALGLLLRLRHHPGERLIVALHRRRDQRPRVTRALRPAHVRPTRALARGGRLIASALAGRAPPVAPTVA